MFDSDSPPKEAPAKEKADIKPPVPNNHSVLPQSPNNPPLPPDIPFGSLPLAGTYSERLRNLAAQPKLENVTSGDERETFSADLMKAQATEFMDRARTESLMNIMNSYQIFNTIPLDKLRRCKETMDGVNGKMADVAEGFTRTSSTDPVTNSNRSSPDVAVSMATSRRMSLPTLPTTAVTYADVDVQKNSSPTAAAWNLENCQNSRRKRAPVKLTSSGVTTAGNNVSNGDLYSYNGSDISVCENYTYTLENSEQVLAQWKQRAAMANTTHVPVDADNNDTSSSDCSTPELTETQHDFEDYTKESPEDKKRKNIRPDEKFLESNHDESNVAKRVCLELERGAFVNGTENVQGNNEDDIRFSLERNTSETRKRVTDYRSADSITADAPVSRTTASQSHSMCDEPSDVNGSDRQTFAPTSNSRKRKAFQPQRVVHGEDLTDYCI